MVGIPWCFFITPLKMLLGEIFRKKEIQLVHGEYCFKTKMLNDNSLNNRLENYALKW